MSVLILPARRRVALMAVCAAAGCGGAPDGQAKASSADASVPQTMAVVAVHTSNARRTIAVPGELRPYEEVRVYSRVPGFVRDVLVDRGSVVRKGDVLARLDAPELTSQALESQSRADAADASLVEAETRQRASSATFARIRAAAATDGAIAPDEVDRALATARADSARLIAAKGQAAAAHSAQQAVSETAAYLTVTAPFDGIVTERDVHPGALVGLGSAAAPMFALQNNSRLRLVVSIPEAYVGSVTSTGVATFQLRAFPSDTFHATLARRSGSVSAALRAEAMEFDVGNQGLRLEPGMYADVIVPVARSAPTLVVPTAAVATSVNGPFVIALKGDTTHWVNVRKGDVLSGDRVEIFGDLHDGDLVAARATEEIRSGTRVRGQRTDTARVKP
ncbi:MAG: efflux RND transporter periplasmic adaptor subunit [Gemmatimonadaceae bacterium]